MVVEPELILSQIITVESNELIQEGQTPAEEQPNKEAAELEPVVEIQPEPVVEPVHVPAPVEIVRPTRKSGKREVRTP